MAVAPDPVRGGLIRRGLALLIALGLAAWARGYGELGGALPAAGAVAALALGVTLLGATLLGALFERARLPRVTGYLLFGLACGPYAWDIVSREMAQQLQLVNGLAVALIAFVAGLEIDWRELRPRAGTLARMGLAVVALPAAALFVFTWLAWPWLPLAAELHGSARAAVAAMVALLAVSFSPTITVAVMAESRARGPLAETVLALVVLADLALVVGFVLVLQAVRAALGAAHLEEVGVMPLVSWELFGSLAFGGVVGGLFALYVRFVGRELTLALLALCATLAVLGVRFQFEPLLAALAAGLVLRNLAPTLGQRLHTAVDHSSLPVLVVFFAASGAALRLDAFVQLIPAVLALAVVRAAVVWQACRWGTAWSGLEPAVGAGVWRGLVSQAGVTLGLAAVVAGEFPSWGERVQAVVIGLVALHQVVGPVLFRRALEQAGEVGRAEA
ncbi:MAG: cation:proton antiporter [Vicinamibacteria bacterium]|nr:cation:proton antiporter [Vicinamibacteria bacterium]